jgi:hypothetical protein
MLTRTFTALLTDQQSEEQSSTWSPALHCGDIALLAGVFLAMLAYLLARVPAYLDIAHGGDYPHYLAIAEAPMTNSVPAPWRYRLLNPWLASFLIAAGATPATAFLALTTLFSFVSCLLMIAFLRALGLSAFASRTGALLFAVSVGGFIPLRRYFGYTDGLTNCFILFALIVIMQRRYTLLTMALAVGALAKESVLLLLPFVSGRMLAVPAPVMKIAVVLAIPIAVFASIRLLLPPDASGSAAVALTWEEQLGHWRNAMTHGVGRWILWSFAYSMGPVWLIAALAAPANVPFIRQSALYLLPVIAPILRTTDTDRALMLAFPIVFGLAAAAMERCSQLPGKYVICAAAVGCTFATQLTFSWSALRRFGPVNEKDLVFLALCLLPVGLLLTCRGDRRPAQLSWN